MFCSNCGAELQPGQKFCHNCGHPTSQQVAAEVQDQVPTMPVVPVAADAPAEAEVPAEPVVSVEAVMPDEAAEPVMPVVPEEPVMPAEPVVPTVSVEPVMPAEAPEAPAMPEEPTVPQPPLDPASPAADQLDDEPKTWGFSQANDDLWLKSETTASATEVDHVWHEIEPTRPQPLPIVDVLADQDPTRVTSVPADGSFAEDEPSEPVVTAPADEPTVDGPTTVIAADAPVAPVEPTLLMSQVAEASTPAPQSQPAAQPVASPYDGIPQPVATQMPTRGSSAPVAPAGLETPAVQTATYAQVVPQQDVPLTPQVVEQPKQRRGLSTGLKVAAATLVAFILIRVGLSALGFFGSDDTKPVDTGITEVQTEKERPTSIVPDVDEEPISNNKPVSSVGADPVSDVSASTYLAANGYPTLLAYMDLTGQQLADLVQANGYIYYESEDADVYAKEDGTVVFNAVLTDGSANEASFTALGRGGIGQPVVYVTVLEGFDSVEEVLSGIANCSVTMQKTVGDGKELVALVHGPSLREYLVNIYDVEDGDYEIDLYNPEAIEVGFFDVVNDGTYGSTTGEVYKNYGA